ncbi:MULTISPECIES: hypothetical protein [unclassified Nocardia]|uniref:hypothetical protein n=1 Tax=unclassified Nocardia TaxID=2637762 RepID=UPI001CE43BCB|nr:MULTISPECIES: hypothetical protein [unclassified Nocardia]
MNTKGRQRNSIMPCRWSLAGREVAVAALVLTSLLVNGCGHQASSSQADLLAPPTNMRWMLYQGIALPHADQGPLHEEGGAATGFAHSPQGAALAAITHTVRLSVAPDGQWPHVIGGEIEPGPAVDAWAVNRVLLSISGTASPRSAPRLIGYRIANYQPGEAAVTVFTEYPDTSRTANAAVVVWNGNDWRLRLPSPSATTDPVTEIAELPSGTVALAAPR